MKWLYWIGGLLLAAWFSPFGILWKDVGTWRFRTVLAVETPEGVREASSVGQASYGLHRSINGGGMASNYAIRGEAVFLDLPGGRNLVLLLAHGPMGDNVDGLAYVVRNRLLGRESTDALAAEGARPLARVVLTEQDIPTLVTFKDVTNPASAQVVYATGTEERWVHGRGLVHVGKVFVDRFTALYGPGFALKEVRLEMVSAGLWPFNLLPIPFPQALFGTPITTGIEKRLPGLKSIEEWNRRARPRLSPADSYGGGSGALIRNW